MQRPFFSVIIPIFNRAFCITRCLKSVEIYLEGNTFEVILVDDGSTDNSVDVVKSVIEDRPEYQLIILPKIWG